MNPLLHFDPRKPFQPLVMNYVAALVGVRQLAHEGIMKFAEQLSSRGLTFSYARKLEWTLSPEMAMMLGLNRSRPRLQDVLDAIERGPAALAPLPPIPGIDRIGQYLEGNIESFLEPLEIESHGRGSTRIELDQVCLQLIDDSNRVVELAQAASGSLLISAYEQTRAHHDHGPLWQFLRHCRNAAAHGGRFGLRPGEPRHLAEWSGIRIERSHDGTPIFHGSVPGLLTTADLIWLLADIEKAHL